MDAEADNHYIKRFRNTLQTEYGTSHQNLRYAGCENTDYFQKFCDSRGIPAVQPEHRDQCVCKHKIKNNFFLFDMKHKNFIVVGSVCHKRYKYKKRCGRCEVVHKNRTDNFCSKCRIVIRKEKREAKRKERFKKLRIKEEDRNIREFLRVYMNKLSEEDLAKVTRKKLRRKVLARFGKLEMSREEMKKVVKSFAKCFVKTYRAPPPVQEKETLDELLLRQHRERALELEQDLLDPRINYQKFIEYCNQRARDEGF